MDLKRLVSMRCSSCSQQSFLGDGCSSGIACPDKHIRLASSFLHHHLTDDVGSSPLLRFPPIDALEMGSVCHIYTIVHFLQEAARYSHYFSFAEPQPDLTKKSWHEAALRQGRVSLITKILALKRIVGKLSLINYNLSA